MPYKPITQDTRDEWSRLHAEGHTASAIARQYGVRQETVSRSLKGLTKPVGRPRKYACRREAAKARYAANREANIARSMAYYWANHEARKEYQRGQNRAVVARASVIADEVVRTFGLLETEQQREDYAHWLLLLGSHDRYVGCALGFSRVDSLLAEHSGV